METSMLAVRLVLGGVVGLGFVTPSVAATLQFAGLEPPLALLGGIVVGIGVFVLIVTRMEKVR